MHLGLFIAVMGATASAMHELTCHGTTNGITGLDRRIDVRSGGPRTALAFNIKWRLSLLGVALNRARCLTMPVKPTANTKSPTGSYDPSHTSRQSHNMQGWSEIPVDVSPWAIANLVRMNERTVESDSILS